MQHRIAVVVPSTINGNVTADADFVAQWVRSAKVRFAQLFGGFTAYSAVGGWVSDHHGLIEEEVIVVSSFTDENGLNRLGEVTTFAAKMAEAMGQEAVSIEVDSKLQFITPLALAA